MLCQLAPAGFDYQPIDFLCQGSLFRFMAAVKMIQSAGFHGSLMASLLSEIRKTRDRGGLVVNVTKDMAAKASDHDGSHCKKR